MRTVKIAIGICVVSFGLLVALYPFVSIWRASSEALRQLPEIEGAEFTDQRHRVGALFNDEMILARRTYPALNAEQVRLALVDAGFVTRRDIDGHWQTMECCGEWDAVLAKAEDQADGGATVLLTMADGDIQLSWGIFPILGLPILAIGVAVLTASLRADRQDQSEAQVLV